MSALIPVKLRVPQGSILVPLIFLLHINDFKSSDQEMVPSLCRCGISSLERYRLKISIANDAATNLRGPLGLRRLDLEAVGPSRGLLMPPMGHWGQRGPSKVSWEAYWSGVMDPGPWEGPKVTPSVLFSSFVNQELMLKQLVELKKGHLRTSERSSYPLLIYSALGWVLSCFLGPWSTNWLLSGLWWPP